MSIDLGDRASAAGLALDAEALARLERYRDLIAAAAAKFSLTAVRDPAAIEERHLLESLRLGRSLADEGLLPAAARVLDLGSGAGLPGLPLKIARLDLDLHLLEASAKRCRFLRETVAALDLTDVMVIEGRAETVAHDPGQRGRYDLVLARAVAPLPVLLELALPLLAVGGHLAAIKGSGAAAELATAGKALDTLGGEVLTTLPLVAPAGPALTIVLVRKVAETPARYPRRAGLPAKRPLL